MKGVTISDEKNNLLAFDLIDVLKIIGEKAMHSTWKASNVECIGNSAEELHKISDESISITGEKLFLISSDILQVIDGEFEAKLGKSDKPWLIIRAVDSSAYDVESDDENILNKIRQSFSSVTNLPS